MVNSFLNYLQKRSIDFCIINGYEKFYDEKIDNDKDILFKKGTFNNIENILQEFCKQTGYKIVQVYHQDVYAKNFFIVDIKNLKFLNLDLYGELRRSDLTFFSEDEIFSNIYYYKNLPILSPEKEFIFYVYKKLDKNDMSLNNFEHLKKLYLNSEEKCKNVTKKIFPKHHQIIIDAFIQNNFSFLLNNRQILVSDFCSTKKLNIKQKFLNILRSIKRIIKPTGLTISFLGPDGSGKSTIIDILINHRLPFRRKEYFHLKPIKSSKLKNDAIVTDEPHKYPPYSKAKSYIKLLYFIWQYNYGWVKYIISLKIKSSLIIFDRYFDDLLVDTKRYRYGSSLIIAKIARFFIPRPDIYFILTADPEVIYERKQEVPFEELKRQIKAYEALVDDKQYFHINVDKTPEEIEKKIVRIMMEKMNERIIIEEAKKLK